jgi:LytS/YehU family sensor histidine kinase
MIIQIPVENAIKHGLMPLESDKKLQIVVQQNGVGTMIRITDNGVGREKSKGKAAGTGTGLKLLLQTIQLLNELNPQQIEFGITDHQPNGTTVKVLIPNGIQFNQLNADYASK